MADTRKPQQELERQLRERLTLLRKSADEFDRGDRSEATRIAAELRIVAHDTTRSQSLLGLLGIKGTLLFLDTSDLMPSAPGTLMLTGGLAWLEFPSARHMAPLDRATVFGRRPFDAWWTGLAIRVPDTDTGNPRDFRRSDLVLTVANKDGGAHIDPDIDRTFFELTRNSALGEVAVGGKKVEWDSNPVPCALRQIAYEFLRTIEEQAPTLL